MTTTGEEIVVFHVIVYLTGLTESCTADNECSGVSNAECAGETGKKVCSCKANYKSENSQCNTANGK